MKAVILAAGLGARMRPLTDATHKTLLPIMGDTVLGVILKNLRKHNIMDVVIVTGYRADEVKKYAQQFSDMRFEFVHNEKYAATNNIYSLMLAFTNAKTDQDLLIIESDLIFDPGVISQIVESPHANVALVDHFRFGMDGTVVTMHDNVISQVIPAHLQDEDFNYDDKYKTLNIYKFSREFCNKTFKKLLVYYAETIDDECYYELILGFLVYMQSERIYGELVGYRWAEVDDPNDLNTARYIFDRESRSELLGASFGGYWHYDVTDFCFIRNMYFPHGPLLSTIRRNLPKLIQNYGSSQPTLERKLSYALLCDAQKCIALNGASQAYPILANLFSGKKFLLPTPSFGEYARCFQDAEHYPDAVGFSASDIEKSLQQKPVDVAVIVNPNNPTGSWIESEAILKLAAAHSHVMFLVDESFIEFSPTESLVALLEKTSLQNIIVLKSLSKSLGMPGLRLGYAYTANAELAEQIRAQLPIWNLNSVAEFFLESWIKYRNEIKTAIADTIRDRAQFAELLAGLPGVENVYPSGANFLLLKLNCGKPADGERIVASLLAEHEIYVKDVSARFNEGRPFLRLAVRVDADHQQLAKKLTLTLRRLDLSQNSG